MCNRNIRQQSYISLSDNLQVGLYPLARRPDVNSRRSYLGISVPVLARNLCGACDSSLRVWRTDADPGSSSRGAACTPPAPGSPCTGRLVGVLSVQEAHPFPIF